MIVYVTFFFQVCQKKVTTCFDFNTRKQSQCWFDTKWDCFMKKNSKKKKVNRGQKTNQHAIKKHNTTAKYPATTDNYY